MSQHWPDFRRYYIEPILRASIASEVGGRVPRYSGLEISCTCVGSVLPQMQTHMMRVDASTHTVTHHIR